MYQSLFQASLAAEAEVHAFGNHNACYQSYYIFAVADAVAYVQYDDDDLCDSIRDECYDAWFNRMILSYMD